MNIFPDLQFPCDMCDYVATQKGNLKTHKEMKHEGIKEINIALEYFGSKGF